ncbi:MAG TPA: hypothetical protein H9714_00575 [Candidatus Flavonifractor intestinipullorum]|uniref:Uncharacterized protein n=1 Tax=Candidatus Flavonifractor intestinipullorum TaxID=2838587 RepID=A0A9D2M8C4_9FIRM|nr:hypothetical protein [Candidatus Flavonifractor intestinipullorum]
MVGWMALEARRGWAVTEEVRTTAGLRLHYVGVPAGKAGRRPSRRALERGARRLRRAGCRRVLAAPGFPAWALLRAAGLRPVDPGPLCAALAAPLALAWLAREGLAPERATVALAGGRVDRALFETAAALAPRVRALAVEVPREGEALLRLLEREWGLPALEGARGGADLTLRFPGAPAGTGAALDLSGTEAGLDGLVPAGPEELPGTLERLPLLALLWEEGRLKKEEIRIQPGKSLDRTGQTNL